MFWLLMVVIFMTDGSIVPASRVEPSQKACQADITDITAQPKPEGVRAAGFQCLGPYSNPATEKSASLEN